MDENHQDTTGSKLRGAEDKLWLPPLSPKDQKRLKRLKSLTERMGFSGKTVWDWLQLLLQLLTALALPIALFIATQWFTTQQNKANEMAAATRYANDQLLAADQQRETTLQTYLDDMSNLLLNNKLLESQPRDAVRQVARERTITTLRRLEANRNRIVVQFLQDTSLIGVKNAVISLSFADLSNDDLKGIKLIRANLSDANLSGADLSGATLNYANLSFARLGGANLSGADLSEATLFEANLSEATLFEANLSGANLFEANLRKADLREANLDGAVDGAKLDYADLSGANLSGANLNHAYLDKAILKGARYNTKEIVVKDSQGYILGKIPPTQWPQGFDPKAAGATETNTFP